MYYNFETPLQFFLAIWLAMLAKNIGKDTENDKLYVNDKNNDNNIGNYGDNWAILIMIM